MEPNPSADFVDAVLLDAVLPAITSLELSKDGSVAAPGVTPTPALPETPFQNLELNRGSEVVSEPQTVSAMAESVFGADGWILGCLRVHFVARAGAGAWDPSDGAGSFDACLRVHFAHCRFGGSPW